MSLTSSLSSKVALKVPVDNNKKGKEQKSEIVMTKN